MNRASAQLLRASLVVVWLATAVVSVWELHGQSRELLAGLPTAWAGGHAPWLPTAIILAGAERQPQPQHRIGSRPVARRMALLC